MTDPTAPSIGTLQTLRNAGHTWPEIARLYPPHTASTLRKRLSRHNKQQTKASDSAERMAVAQLAHPGRITGIEDLFNLFNLVPAEWEIDQLVPNTWEQHSNKHGYKTLIQLRARLKPATSYRNAEILSALREAYQAETEHTKPLVPKTTEATQRHMLSMTIPDLHIGMGATDRNGTQTYNLEIASKLYRDAVSSLARLSAIYEPSDIYFPIGNDMLHADTSAGTTTAGTYVAPIAGVRQTWLTAHSLITEALRTLRQHHPGANIHIPIIPGNHDEQNAWTLGMAIADRYHNDPSVNVITQDQESLIVHWNEILLAYSHGAIRSNAKDMAMTMAIRNPQEWARSRTREWHLAHTHHQRTDSVTIDEQAVLIRRLPTLIPPDAYTEKHLWHNVRGAACHIYNTTHHVATLYHHP